MEAGMADQDEGRPLGRRGGRTLPAELYLHHLVERGVTW